MVVLPANSNFSMQINSFLKASIQQKNMELEHRNYIHEKLMEILLRGENPGDLARILAELLRRPVLLLDQHLDLMAAQPAAAETLPLPECDAMTQGYIGYHMEDYIEQEQFAPGSMLPKVEASIDFVRDDPGRKAIITSISNLRAALRGETGTEIRSTFPQPS